jgi:hypothetical protein
MKTKIMIIISLCVFLVLSVFSCTKIRQVKKITREKTELLTKFTLLEKEKDDLRAERAIMQDSLKTIESEKLAMEIQFAKDKADTDKQLQAFKDKIKDLSSLPADTVYQYLFAKWPTYSGVLKFRFAENQIREMWLNVLERDNYLSLYEKSGISLNDCAKVNLKNNDIIQNLKGQNTNLQQQVDISGSQITNLQDNLKVTNKELNRKKFWNWILKGSSGVGIAGWIAFVLK